MLLDGTLESNENLSLYTHKMLVGSGYFGIRSKTINLFDYTGVVTIKGNITDIMKDIPIISVSEIIGKTIVQEQPFEYNEKFYYSQATQLWVNLSTAKGYTVQDDMAWTMSIIDTQTVDQSEILKIVSFQCTDNDPIKDCKKLLESFSSDEQKSYTNSQGIKFYNLPETNTRVAIPSEQQQWYFVYPKNDEVFNVFISLIYIYTPQDIKDATKKEISQCTTMSGSLQEIQQWIISYPNKRRASVRLEGLNEKQELWACSFDVRLDATLESKLSSPWESITTLSPSPEHPKINTSIPTKVSFSGATNTGSWLPINNLALKPLTTWEKVIFASTGTKISIVQAWSGSEESETTKYLWWLKHQSVRGYSLYYSKKWIKFYGQIIDNATNLDIPGINCSYKVSISPYTSTGDAADVEVYECKGLPSTSILQEKGYTLAWSTGSLSFLVDYKTDILKDLQVKVE